MRKMVYIRKREFTELKRSIPSEINLIHSSTNGQKDLNLEQQQLQVQELSKEMLWADRMFRRVGLKKRYDLVSHCYCVSVADIVIGSKGSHS